MGLGEDHIINSNHELFYAHQSQTAARSARNRQLFDYFSQLSNLFAPIHNRVSEVMIMTRNTPLPIEPTYAIAISTRIDLFTEFVLYLLHRALRKPIQPSSRSPAAVSASADQKGNHQGPSSKQRRCHLEMLTTAESCPSFLDQQHDSNAT